MARSTSNNKLKVVTIVLTWNSADFVTECLKSLKKSHYASEILVVDNDSSDKTRTLIAKKFPGIEVVNSGANRGYAGGNNFGIKHVLKNKPDYIFIVNPDDTVDPDCLGLMVERMEKDRNLAVVSPMIYYDNTDTISFAGSDINWMTGVTPHIGAGQRDEGQFNDQRIIERAQGGAMVLRREAIEKVGLMDERFFIYYEETDWSVRFKRAGFEIGLVPLAKVWHSEFTSFGGRFSPTYQYYMTRNKLLFVAKHKPIRLPIVFVASLYLSFRTVIDANKHTGSKNAAGVAKAIGKSYVDFLLHRFGRRQTSR